MLVLGRLGRPVPHSIWPARAAWSCSKAGAICSISARSRPTSSAAVRHWPVAIADVTKHSTGIIVVEPELLGDAHQRVHGRRRVVKVDGGAQMLRSGARIRVQIEGGRQSPAGAVGTQEPVVAQMVVRVGDENGEGDAPPQLPQILAGVGGVTLDDVGDLQIASLIAVPGFEHCHRAHVADTQVSGSVESVDDEHRPARRSGAAPNPARRSRPCGPAPARRPPSASRPTRLWRDWGASRSPHCHRRRARGPSGARRPASFRRAAAFSAPPRRPRRVRADRLRPVASAGRSAAELRPSRRPGRYRFWDRGSAAHPGAGRRGHRAGSRSPQSCASRHPHDAHAVAQPERSAGAPTCPERSRRTLRTSPCRRGSAAALRPSSAQDPARRHPGGPGSRCHRRTWSTLSPVDGATRAVPPVRLRLQSARRLRLRVQPSDTVRFLGRTRCGSFSSERSRPTSVS